MFEYRLPSLSFFSYLNPWRLNPLLKSIQIQGPFITIYGRKTVGEELSGVLEELKGRVIQGDDIEHDAIHDNMVDALFWSNENPHVHYTMPNKSLENGITDLITAIFQCQNPTVREQDHRKLLASVERDRLRLGDKELPDYIKKTLAQIDTKSPFFLSQNSQELIQDILSKYGEYCRRPSNDRCRELLKMYFFGPLKNIAFSVFIEKNVDETEQTRIKSLFQPFDNIIKCLETAQKEPLNTEVLQQIQSLIQQVNVNEFVKLENRDDKSVSESLQERLDFISRYTQERIKTVEEYKKTRLFYIYSFFNRISQVFHNIFSYANPRTT